MDYAQAIAYIKELTKFGINLGLSRMERLLFGLGNPHDLPCIHVGGTNGKGSVSAMLGSILQASGFRVGLFTSPHLERYTERFQINGEEISQENLAFQITEIKPYIDKMLDEGFEHPTEFEVSTALAFKYFQEEKVDIAVIEVGMGGELDSTNVVSPLVSIITNVSLEHQNVLGFSLSEIARAKGGIIKSDVPLVTACAGEPWLILKGIASQKGAPVVKVQTSSSGENMGSYRTVRLLGWRTNFHKTAGKKAVPSGQNICVLGLYDKYPDLRLPLLGFHQGINAATAIAAVELLQEKGLSLSKKDIYQGLATVSWPGRLEIVCQEPLTILDGAHNVEGIRSLVNFIRETFYGWKKVLICGIFEDKDRMQMIQELIPVVNSIIVTRPPGSRAGDWLEVARQAQNNFSGQVMVYPRLEDALTAGIAEVEIINSQNEQGLLCITGSLYLMGEARNFFNQ